MAFLQRPDYQQAQLNLKNSRLSLKVVQDNSRYNLDFGVTYQLHETGKDHDEAFSHLSRGLNETLGATLTFSMPLGNTIQQNQLRSQSLQHFNDQLNFDSFKYTIRLQVEDAIMNLRISQKQFYLAQQAKKLAKQQWEVERLKLNQGVGSVVDVVRAQDIFLNVSFQEKTSMVNHLNNIAQWEFQTGTLLRRRGIVPR